MSSLLVAVAGCAHGELDRIFSSINRLNEENERKVDLLICCGDFQAVRNYSDLKCMAVPPKYQQLQTFYKYYSGEQCAPVLTLFVGGNHEATNYLTELPYGGWVAPNIFYLGFAGVVSFRGLRIGGLSGIYKGHHYQKGHYESPPYNEDTKRSAYHMRNLETFRFKQLKKDGQALDILISHDWPRGVDVHGDQNRLFKIKPFFRDEAQKGTLGNPATASLLEDLKPKRWFSAHMHVKFEANVIHQDESETKFLALDKPTDNKNRIFLEVIDVELPENGKEQGLSYDPDWLAILKSTDHLLNLKQNVVYMPGPRGPDGERYDFRPTETELEEIGRLFDYNFLIPENFRQTAPCHQPNDNKKHATQSLYYRNPQTAEFCEKLKITDWNFVLCDRNPTFVGEIVDSTTNDKSHPVANTNPEEICLDDEEEVEEEPDLFGHFVLADSASKSTFVAPAIKRSSNEVQDEKEDEMPNALAKMKRRNVELYEPNVDDI